MTDGKEKSVKKRRRLQLNGPDDEYAKRDAVQAQPKEQQAVPEPTKGLKPEQAQPKVIATTKPSQPKSTTQIPVNIRLPVGADLTLRLKTLADKHGQPIEPILKAARMRAAERLITMVESNIKPKPANSEVGGEVTRFATTFSGKNAVRLNAWYDPFDLGVAKDGIKPIMTKLLQEEVAKICDAVS